MFLSSVSSRLLLYDTNNWELKISNGCHDAIMRDISWSDDSKYILQVNSAGLVEILSPADRDVRTLQHIPLKDTWSASFHRDGHRNIAVGTKSGNVKIWDTKNKTITKTFPSPSHPSCVQILSYNAKNTSLAATMTNGDTIIYGLVSNIPVLTVKLSCSKSITAMKFHHESRSLLGLATDEGHVVLRDITTNKDKAFFENAHASPVSDFSFSLINKDVLISCGYDKIIQVYDIRLQTTVSTVKTFYTLTSLTMNIDNQVALGTKKGDILIYDLRDLSGPSKVLKGHDSQVSKVAFQPARKNTLSADISLREEVETSTYNKLPPPNPARSSDIFFLNNTPPNNHFNTSNSSAENKADMSSFLVTVGLDKSIDFPSDPDKSTDFEKKIDKHELRFDSDKNMSKISTPLNSRMGDGIFDFPSPLCIPNSAKNDNGSNANLLNITPSTCNVQPTNITDPKILDELKNFITLNISDVTDDSRNYFLHVMMALTKQKLYLEKQFTGLNQQLHSLVQSQNDLVEANRMLALQVEQLKMQQNNIYSYNNN